MESVESRAYYTLCILEEAHRVSFFSFCGRAPRGCTVARELAARRRAIDEPLAINFMPG